MPIDLVQLGLTGAFLAVEVSLLSDGGSGSPTISAIEAVFEHGDNNL
jgi:hypothetical protein